MALSSDFEFLNRPRNLNGKTKRLRKKPTLKICPECDKRFTRTKKEWVRVLDVEVKANICPRCQASLFYRRDKGGVTAVLMEDKVLVDQIVSKINQNLRERSDFKVNLGEATSRERKFAYSLISHAIDFLEGAEADIGMNIHQFLLGFVGFLLEDDWWGMHLNSLLMIQNQKHRLLWEYWEMEARLRHVETPRSAKTKKRLSELALELSELSN